MTSGDEISAAEARLGVRLPPSYRACLTNGDNLPGEHDLRLLDLGSIDRFARREPDWLEAWMEGARSVAEAEAWDFATWYPGAYRYRSFAHLVEALERKG